MISASVWPAGCRGTAEMAQGLVTAIFRAYSDLRAAQVAQEQQSGEERILFYAVLSGFLLFLAGLPTARQQAGLTQGENPLLIVISARFFGALFVLPLVLYGVAALSHLVCRAFGGTGSFRAARLALFWALLVTMPVLIAVSLLAVPLTALPIFPLWLLGLVVLVAFARIWGEGLAGSEGFVGSLPISVVVSIIPIVMFVSIAGLRA